MNSTAPALPPNGMSGVQKSLIIFGILLLLFGGGFLLYWFVFKTKIPKPSAACILEIKKCKTDGNINCQEYYACVDRKDINFSLCDDAYIDYLCPNGDPRLKNGNEDGTIVGDTVTWSSYYNKLNCNGNPGTTISGIKLPDIKKVILTLDFSNNRDCNDTGEGIFILLDVNMKRDELVNKYKITAEVGGHTLIDLATATETEKKNKISTGLYVYDRRERIDSKGYIYGVEFFIYTDRTFKNEKDVIVTFNFNLKP